MSGLISIGVSGLRAYQSALTTVSENIANASTPGYSRRTASVREVAAPGSTSGASFSGLGVAVSAITRAADSFRSAEVRSTGSDLARTEASATWLDRIEGALTGDKLGDRLTAFFNSARSLAADPSSLASRSAMLEAAADVANAFAATGDSLAAAAAELEQSTDAAVTELNGLAASLARTNTALGRSSPGTSAAAALLDERDRLLESMSAIADVSASFDEFGRAAVRIGGASGPPLVQGDTTGLVTAVQNGEGAFSFAVHNVGETASFAPNGGALAGAAEGALRIAAAREALDALATDFVSGINDLQANGRDLDGADGAPMFEAGDSPSDITLVLSDPRGIAAASVGGGARDNGNLAALEALRGSGGYEASLSGLVTANAAALSSRRTVATAQAAIRDSAVARRDSLTGVNIDEEAVNLLRFQQAFQASARVIQVASETLQTMLEIR